MNFSFLSGTLLFRGVPEPEIGGLIESLCGRSGHYEKGEVIYRCGETAIDIGLVQSGGVIIKNDDFWGNQSVLARIEPGDIFAETYACIGGKALLVDAVAAESTEVLFISAAEILSPKDGVSRHCQTLTGNLLTISAIKNIRLSCRILYTSPKHIRGRLTAFLSDAAKEQGSERVTVPFSRQQLADFLNVDRSAMCAELSKMQKDGIIEYKKNIFLLKNIP